MTQAEPRPLVVRAGRALGSPLRLTVAGSDAVANRAWALVECVFAEVDAAMSRFRDDSALTALNRRSPDAVSDVPRMLMQALVAADRATRVTGGAFDPRIVAALERIGYVGVPQGSPVHPEPRAVAGTPASGAAAPARILERRGRRGSVDLPVAVDLGGIGKGLALRWSARALERDARERAGGEGVVVSPGFLIDAGGDIVARGTAGPFEPWAVGIENPADAGTPLAVVRIDDGGAIATSSIGRLRWQVNGQTVHHIIDPRTGEPGGAGLLAVTVATTDPAWAEVWSKALFLEGAARIAGAARRRDIAAWWVTTAGQLEMTPAARQRTTWVAAEA